MAGEEGLVLAASYRAEEGRSLAAKLLLLSRASRGCSQVRLTGNLSLIKHIVSGILLLVVKYKCNKINKMKI